MVETGILSSRTALAVAMVAALGGAIATVAMREAAQRAALGPPATPEGDAAETVEAAGAAPDAGGVPESAAATAAETAVPSFDVVRVTPDGAALVAGRAEPGATVTVRAGEAAVAEVEAGPGGEFVAIFKAPPAAAPRALTLESGGVTGGAVSRETVLLLPPAPAAPPAVAEAGDAADWAPAAGGTETAAAIDPAAVGDGGSAADAVEVAAATPGREAAPEAAAAEPAPEVAATAILREDEVEVVAPPQDAGGPRRVSLASISYGEAGSVTLAGFGTAGSAVRVYVDGDHSVDGAVDSGGRWRLALGDIAAGVYRLRVDEIGPDGRVASRAETPFQRDFPELAPAPGDGEQKITVQPGNNLWTIARERYGEGIRYTQIFTANAALISDPELIYPGQIFVLPVVEGAGAPVVEGPLRRP